MQGWGSVAFNTCRCQPAPTRSACSSLSLWGSSVALHSSRRGRQRARQRPAGTCGQVSQAGGAQGNFSAGLGGSPRQLGGRREPRGRGLGVEEPSAVRVHLVGLLIHNRAELPGASAPLPSIKIIGTSLQRFMSREGARSVSFFLCLAPSSLPHSQAHLSAVQPLQPRSPFHRPVLFPLSPSESPRFLERTLIYHGWA